MQECSSNTVKNVTTLINMFAKCAKPAKCVTTRTRVSWLSPRGHAPSLMERTVSLSKQGRKNLWWGEEVLF